MISLKNYMIKQCDIINLNNTSTYFYICDDTIDIYKMKKFSFFPNSLNEPIEFILSPEDLFFKFGKNKPLYIIGFNYDIDYWKFNLPFIMKYQPIFDIENKIITIYNDLNLFNESDFNIDTNTKNTNNELKGGKTKRETNFFKIISIFIYCLFLKLIKFITTKKKLFHYRQGKYKTIISRIFRYEL